MSEESTFTVRIDGLDGVPAPILHEYRLKVEERATFVHHSEFQYGDVVETGVYQRMRDGEIVWEIEYTYKPDSCAMSNNPAEDLKREILDVSDQMMKDLLGGAGMPT